MFDARWLLSVACDMVCDVCYVLCGVCRVVVVGCWMVRDVCCLLCVVGGRSCVVWYMAFVITIHNN